MSRRFFVDSPITDKQAQLTGSEHQHLVQVMRARAGDSVILFDGSGAEYSARVIGIERSRVDLEVLARHEVDRELGISITLGIALPKGERQRWLIEKAVELGVACIVPLVADRGVAKPVERVTSRLHKYVVEASKQCGRNRLLQIASPRSTADFLIQAPADSLRVLAHVVDSAASIVELVNRSVGNGVYLAIGPEGGFSERELEAAEQWQVVSLGPRVLRVETAALALIAYFSLPDARSRTE